MIIFILLWSLLWVIKQISLESMNYSVKLQKAIEVQAKIYEENGDFQDFYFSRIKNKLKFVLMDCNGGDDTCFCLSMNSNVTDNWSIAIKQLKYEYLLSVKDEEFTQYFDNCEQAEYSHEFVKENSLTVKIKDIPNKDVLNKLKQHPFWQETEYRSNFNVKPPKI